MKETAKILLPLLLSFNLIAARAQQSGIHFETGLSWDQIKQKAQTEHVHIFIDCYATWCGPCKYMDANIYPLKPVGNVYNGQFICIRLQMDRTAKDNDTVKSWYYTASEIAKDYHVDAYPTFLVFDENGKPVHKVSGSLNEKEFIQLAADAKNPEKQYYAILNNFRPGKLDTVEEKGLAASFVNSDKELATRLALDYFRRIPKGSTPTGENITLLKHLNDNPEIREIPGRYLKQLNGNDMGQPLNRSFAEAFNRDSVVRPLIKKYINTLPEEKLYDKPTILFLSAFIDGAQDTKGFNFFYHHTQKIDAIMGKDVAEGVVQGIINNTEFKPALIRAKQTGTIPNFDSIKKVITRKYNADYAERVIISGKTSWYGFLLQNKHGDQYWPQYVDALIAQVNRFRTDTLKDTGSEYFINNISYKIFAFDTVKEQLLTVLGWMKEQAKRNPGDPTILDTYASLLYKTGQTGKAIETEQIALVNATKKNDKNNITWCSKTIEKMKKGEAIWTEKEYQQ